MMKLRDTKNERSCGPTTSVYWAWIAPPAPTIAVPTTKVATLTYRIEIPVALAAMGSSRTAREAKPSQDLSKLQAMYSATSAAAAQTGTVVRSGMPEKLFAPPM